MILRAWSGALIDTAEYPWTIWPRWAMGWVRYALESDPEVRRCRARSASGLRCWERRGHLRPHGHERRPRKGWHELRSAREYRWTEEKA